MHITWDIFKSITLTLIQKTQSYYMKIITVFWEQPQAVDREGTKCSPDVTFFFNLKNICKMYLIFK